MEMKYVKDLENVDYKYREVSKVSDVGFRRYLRNSKNLGGYFLDPMLDLAYPEDLARASAQMDLSRNASILTGSRRSSPDVRGNDILGGGIWDQSLLNDMLFIPKQIPFGRPVGSVPEDGTTILTGSPKPP